MKIGGFQKTSLVDYPGKVSSVVFTAGCNLRCHFCYVPQLVLPEMVKEIREVPEGYILSYLERNRVFIDSVVLTGGEPTIYEDLPDFVRKVKSRGFLVGLETNGTNASMLSYLVNEKLVDYVAMDVKTRLDFERYNHVVGGVLTNEMFENIKASIKVLTSSDVLNEFRTTLVKELHERADVLEICKTIGKPRAYYLQNFRKMNGNVGGRNFTPFRDEEIEEVISEAKKFVNVNITYRR